jgi:hypothetical protein
MQKGYSSKGKYDFENFKERNPTSSLHRAKASGLFFQAIVYGPQVTAYER